MTSRTVAGVADPGRQRRRLQTVILRSVSRSFYLSIRFLPAQLREPIALAYLLARSTDSVADTTGISNLVRIETLKMLSDGIQGQASRDVVVNLIASFVPLQANKSERQLLESLPDCLHWLEQIAVHLASSSVADWIAELEISRETCHRRFAIGAEDYADGELGSFSTHRRMSRFALDCVAEREGFEPSIRG